MGSSRLQFLPLSSPKTIAFIPSVANKQKIKILDHYWKCNVSSKNAEQQAFSTRDICNCDGLVFYFRLFLTRLNSK